jgi:hypothetical protein
MLRHLANRSGNVCSLAGPWACGAALLFGIESTTALALAQAPAAPRTAAEPAVAPRAVPPRAVPPRAVPPRAVPAAESAAPSKASCAEAYESAQESRASGALQQTRSRLAYCAQTECPAFVQKDCAHWLEEVDRELPSIIISVVGLDTDAAKGASLAIDGRVIADSLSGKAITLDPGKHQLVLERPGSEPVTRTLLAQQGVQNRVVEIRVGEEGLSSSASESVFDADAAAPRSSTLRSLAFVSWGAGAVGIGAFAVLGTLARADEDRFREDCASVATTEDLLGPGICLQSTADRRKAKYEREEVLADVGLIAGIAGAAAGTVLFVLSTSSDSPSDAEPKSSARLEVSPLPGGAWASVSGAF